MAAVAAGYRMGLVRQCIAAVAAGYRMGLVSAEWPILMLSCANGRRKRYFHLVGAPFLAF